MLNLSNTCDFHCLSFFYSHNALQKIAITIVISTTVKLQLITAKHLVLSSVVNLKANLIPSLQLKQTFNFYSEWADKITVQSIRYGNHLC